MLLRRSLLLIIGLALFGFSLGLLVSADLGLAPWDVFHQGVADVTGFSLGTIVIATSFVVLLLWIPLHERPGVGTIANAILVGVGLDVSMTFLPEDIGSMWVRVAMMVGGIGLNGVATGMYIGAGMGPGPRDGLMTGLAKRGHSLRLVRTGIEATVLVSGILLGGTFGIGTIVFALCIGPLAHIFIPIFTVFGQGVRPGKGAPAPALR